MSKSNPAVRSYPLSLLFGFLLFALMLAMTASSLGKAGAGGDDEGSGLGGTGRAGESDERDLRASGLPLPYINAEDLIFFSFEEDESELARQEMLRLREELRPVAPPAVFRRSIEVNLARGPQLARSAPVPDDRVDLQRLQPLSGLGAEEPAPLMPALQLELDPDPLDKSALRFPAPDRP